MAQEKTVLVRAYGGEPLRRIAQKRVQTAIFVKAPGSKAPVGMGFPSWDVFEFDQALFDRIQSAFRGKSTELEALWEGAVPVTDL